MTDAIVLAGGREPDLGPGIPNKAFIKIGNRPLVAYVVAALQGARGVGRIVVAGPVEELRRGLPAEVLVVPDGGSIMDNVVNATDLLGSQTLTLVAGADIPLLTSGAIDEFLTACAQDPADFYYAAVPQQAMERDFPGARKTYVRLTDGAFCGGSMMLFNPQALPRVRTFVERALAARKQPWLLAQLFGWSVVLKFAAGRLSMDELVAKATEVMGIKVKPVILPRPELALDVDVGKPENLHMIEAALAARQPAG